MGKIIIVSTGGTIACKVDDRRSGVEPALTGEDLLKTIPQLKKAANYEVYNIFQMPGSDFTFNKLLVLAKTIKVELDRNDVDGVIVTQGTDTIEEVAFFLGLVLKTSKPVIVTGAMRYPDMLGFDGSANINDSLIVASSEEAQGLGVLIVMNSKIHSAYSVTKSNTTNLDAFTSLNGGILGQVSENKVYLFNKPYLNFRTIPVLDLEIKNIDITVHLIKVALDMNPSIIDFAVESGAKGIVLETMGAGHVPSRIVSAVKKAAGSNFPVVISSRTGSGPMLHKTYSFEGSELTLKSAGALFTNLPGLKARIKLILALYVKDNMEYISSVFETD